MSLAQDDTTTGEVAAHAVGALEVDGHRYDAVVILHPTSPFRTAHHIDEAIEHYVEAKRPGLASTEILPFKAHPTVRAGHMWHRGGMVLNAAIYIVQTEHIKATRKHMESSFAVYVMDHKSSIDINDELDFRIAEMILRTSPNEGKRRNNG
jgi:N-acylneuraminate cytidylyltransferase/CMP-N,N'-diacetyllegionaminic acid synthase